MAGSKAQTIPPETSGYFPLCQERPTSTPSLTAGLMARIEAIKAQQRQVEESFDATMQSLHLEDI